MAVALVGTATQANSTTSPVTGTFGSGQNATPGNLLVAIVTAAAATSAAATAQNTGTTGWTKAVEASSTFCKAAVWWKVRGASAESAPAFTSALSGTAGMACTIFELSGADTVTPVATSGTATGTTANPLTVTTSGNVPAAGCAAVSAHCNYRSTTAVNAWTKAASWTNATTNGSSSLATHSASDYYLNPPSGTTLACGGTWANAPTREAAVSAVIELTVSAAVQPASADGAGAGYGATAAVANGPGVGYTAQPSAAIAAAQAWTPDGPPRGVTVHAGTTSLRFRTLPGRGRPGRLAPARSRASAPPAGIGAALAAGFSNGEVTAGLFYPSAGTGLAGGTGTWANPGNALADDGAAATWAVP